MKASALAIIVAVNVVASDARAAQQQAPPIQGVTGTIATESTRDETDAGGRKLLGKIRRLFHVNGPTMVPAGDTAGEEALNGLKKGTRVIVHDAAQGETLTAAAGDKGLKQMNGSVIAVNLGDRTISVRLSDDTFQTLRLSDSAATEVKDLDAGGDGTANVIVYYRNEAGQRVALHFTRVSR